MRSGAVRLASLLVLLAAAAARGQESDFFDQKDSYFQTQTIEGVSKRAESIADTPATVTVIDRDDIERYGFRTLAEVLNFASVGSFTHNDRRYDFAGGRGLFFYEDFNTRVLVMLNGHPLNEPWNNFGGVGREMVVPLELAERIEIIYGPSALLYGGYSLYGIVNVVTRNGETEAGWRLRLSGGSWKTGEAFASFGRAGTAGKKSWNVLAAAGYYRSSGEDLDLEPIDVEYAAREDGGTVWGGPQSGTDFERAPFAFVYARRGDLSLLLRTGFRRHGAPLAPYESLYGSRDEHVQDTKHFGEIRWDRALNARWRASVRVFHDDYTYEENDPFLDAAVYPESAFYTFVLHTDARDTGGEARLHYQAGGHILTLGGEYRARGMTQRSFDRLADGTPGDGSSREAHVTGHLAVAYLQEEWRPADAVSIVAGANLADTQPGGRRAQPRVALIVKPSPPLAVKLLYNEGFRPPSIFEAAYADFTQQIDNPDLRSERIRSGEVSVQWAPNARLSAQAYAFKSRLTGLIRGVEIGDPSDVQGGVVSPSGDAADLVGVLQYQSRGDVETSGAGAALRAKAGRLRGYLNVGFARPRLREADAEEVALPASSTWLGSAGLSFAAGPWTAAAAARYVGPHDLDASRRDRRQDSDEGFARGAEDASRMSADRAGDFAEVNLRISWRTRLRYPLHLHLDVRNVLDAGGGMAASPIYTPSVVPIEGRRILLSADLRF